MKHFHRRSIASWILVLIAVMPLVTGCDTGGVPGGPGAMDVSDIDTSPLEQNEPILGDDPVDLDPGETTTYDVSLKDNAKLVSQEMMAMMLESSDGDTYRFDPAAADVAALVAEDVVIFHGMSVRKIVSVATEADAIVVETESATLEEAIQDGEIAWERNVDFANIGELELDDGAEDSFAITDLGSSKTKSLVRSRSLKVEGNIQGWDVSVEIEPAPSRLNVNLSATYTVRGIMVAAINGTGWVSDFTSCGCLTYGGGSLSTMEIRNEGMRGEMVVTWSAFNAESIPLTEIVQLSVPASIPIPIQIGPIPVLLKLKAVARVVPELRFDGSSSTGNFKATYSASQGFQVQDDAVSTTGSLESGDVGVNGETVSAGFFTTALGVGIEFPRLEVSVLGELASAFVTVDTYAYSLYDPGLASASTPCQEGLASVKAIAGYALSFFGVGVSDQTEIWREEYMGALDGVFCP